MLSKKQFHGFRLGLAATTDSRTARGSGARDGTSSTTVNFSGHLISTDIDEFAKLVRNFYLIHLMMINTHSKNAFFTKQHFINSENDRVLATSII